MDDLRLKNGPNVANRGSPESSCSSKNINNTNITTTSNTIATNAATNTAATATANKEQDRFLPIANVGRIMKKVIPGNGKISKEAKETVQECVSEFISFVTGEASDKCQREKRKTINGDDIIWAITTLGFEDYVSPLKQYLSKYRELEGDQKLHLPKQQQQQQQQQHMQQQQQQNDHQNMPNYSTSSVYSSSPSLMSHPSFVPSDQPFPMPPHHLPSSIQKQFQQQEHNIDSVSHW